jgi:hypothetical protein
MESCCSNSVSGNRFIGNRKSSIVNRLFWWQSIDDLNRSLLNRGNDLFWTIYFVREKEKEKGKSQFNAFAQRWKSEIFFFTSADSPPTNTSKHVWTHLELENTEWVWRLEVICQKGEMRDVQVVSLDLSCLWMFGYLSLSPPLPRFAAPTFGLISRATRTRSSDNLLMITRARQRIQKRLLQRHPRIPVHLSPPS